MVKKVIFNLLLFGLISCDSSTGWDCLQTSGAVMSQQVDLPPFSSILVSGKTQLIIKQGEVQEITLETGENLLSEIKLTIEEDTLVIENDNTCDFVRESALTKVYVTAPNITSIRNASSFPVTSEGVLAFNQLSLLSDDVGDGTDFLTTGGWDLTLDVVQLSVTTNGFTRFELDGKAQRAFYGLFAGHATIEAFDLITQEVSFFHRSSGDLKVHPVQSIRGTLFSVGNVIANNQPPIVEVSVLFQGALLFE